MKKFLIAAVLAFVSFSVAAQQPEPLPTKDQYNAQEISSKALAIGRLLDELAKTEAKAKGSEARVKELEAELAKAEAKAKEQKAMEAVPPK